MENEDPINTTSSFSYLFKPIRDLAENWNIDLASELERYVEELSTIAIKHGANKLNFAEAALLIQGSTKVYEKKVEYLHQLVKETLDFLTRGKQKTKSKKKGEGEDVTEDGDESSHEEKDEEAFEELKEIKLSSNAVIKDLDQNGNRKVDEKRSKLMSSMPMALIPFEELEKTDIPLLSRVGEVLGKKDDFKVNICSVHSKGALILDVANAKLLDCPHDSFVIPPAPTPIEMMRAGTSTQPTIRFSEPAQPLCNENGLSFDDGFEPLDDNSTLVAPAVSVDGNDPEPIGDQRGSVSVNRERREAVTGQQPLIVDATDKRQEDIDAANPWQALDPFVNGKFKEKPRKLGKPFKKAANNRKPIDGVATQYVSEQIEEHFFTRRNKYPQNFLPDGWLAVEDVVYAEYKRRQKLNRQRIQGVDLNEEVQLRMPWGEAVEDIDAGTDEEDDGGAEPFDDVMPDDAGFSDEDFMVQVVPEAVGEREDKRSVETERPNSQMTYEEMVNFHLEHMVSKEAAFTSTTELTQRVQQWEDRIMPILREEEGRRLFDIHEYGSDILDSLGNIGDERMFKDITQEKPRWETCRYFLSSLMLANTYNVEIGKNDHENMESNVNTLSLKLLKKERHHEVFANDGQI